MKYLIAINGQSFNIEVGHIESGVAHVNVNGLDYEVLIEGAPGTSMAQSAVSAPAPLVVKKSVSASQPSLSTPSQPTAPIDLSAGENLIKAPIPGLILEVKVKVGDLVKAGQTVIIMEAMKMENSITTPFSGAVKEIHVQKGVDVKTGSPLLVVG